MSEARRRQLGITATHATTKAWLESLPSEQRIVAETALRLHANFIVPNRHTGACYLLAFFLRQYLRLEHGVEVQAIVGYACDGTSAVQMSHAWIELEGKKTDISLTITEVPEHQIPGDLLVLDRVMHRGVASYSYHLTESAESIEEFQRAVELYPAAASVRSMKQREHTEMLARATDNNTIAAFLAAAPPKVSYEAMANAIRRG